MADGDDPFRRLVEKKNWDGLQRAATKALATDPESLDARWYAAWAALHIETAAKFIDRAATELRTIAQLDARRGEVELDDTYATEPTACSRVTSLDTFIQMRRARACASSGRWKEATKAAQVAAAGAPDCFFAHLWVARYALEAKQFELAEAAATRALELDPDSGVYGYRRTARQNLGDLAGVVADLRAQVRRKPRDVSHHLSLGSALLAIGDASGALAAFELARSLDEQSERAFRGLQAAHEALGDADAAAQAAARAEALSTL